MEDNLRFGLIGTTVFGENFIPSIWDTIQFVGYFGGLHWLHISSSHYSQVQEANVELYKEQKEAEAVLFQQQKQAEAQKASADSALYCRKQEADAELYSQAKEAEEDVWDASS